MLKSLIKRGGGGCTVRSHVWRGPCTASTVIMLNGYIRPLLREQTDMTENITLPQLRRRALAA